MRTVLLLAALGLSSSSCQLVPVDDSPATTSPAPSEEVPPRDAPRAPTLFTSIDLLLGLFPTPEGVLVVTDRGPLLLDAKDVVVARVENGANTAAAFDGQQLVVAEGATLNVYDRHLEVVRSFAAPFACEALGIVRGRVVCGNFEMVLFPRYAVVELESGRTLSNTTLWGVAARAPMRVLEGSDTLVALTQSSPSSMLLLQAADDGVTQLGMGYDVGGAMALPRGTNVAATAGGRVIDLSAPCAADNFTAAECTVNTLATRGPTLALTEGPAGALFALTDEQVGHAVACATACSARKLDVSTGQVTSSQSWPLRDVGQIVAFTWDAYRGRLLVGTSPVTCGPALGFSLSAIAAP